jgi:hypothetical protein
MERKESMDSRVVLVNKEQKIAAVRMNAGKYAVFQVLNEFNIDPGDVVTGQFHNKGITHVANLTKRSLIKAEIKMTDCVVANRVKDMVKYGYSPAVS